MKELINKDIIFDEKKHTYKLTKEARKVVKKSVKFTSVTTFLSSLFPKFDAKAVAKQISNGFKYRNYEKFKQGITVSKLDKQKATMKYWLNEWKKSSEEGTRLHALMEEYINNGDVITTDEERVLAGIKYIKSNGLTKEETTNRYPEIILYDVDYQLAGTCDLLSFKKDGKVILTDWKFTKKITTDNPKGEKGIKESTKHLVNCKVNVYGLQLMTYAYLLKKNYGVIVDELHLVHLKDNKYTIYIIDYDEKLVISVLKELLSED